MREISYIVKQKHKYKESEFKLLIENYKLSIDERNKFREDYFLIYEQYNSCNTLDEVIAIDEQLVNYSENFKDKLANTQEFIQVKDQKLTNLKPQIKAKQQSFMVYKINPGLLHQIMKEIYEEYYKKYYYASTSEQIREIDQQLQNKLLETEESFKPKNKLVNKLALDNELKKTVTKSVRELKFDASLSTVLAVVGIALLYFAFAFLTIYVYQLGYQEVGYLIQHLLAFSIIGLGYFLQKKNKVNLSSIFKVAGLGYLYILATSMFIYSNIINSTIFILYLLIIYVTSYLIMKSSSKLINSILLIAPLTASIFVSKDDIIQNLIFLVTFILVTEVLDYKKIFKEMLASEYRYYIYAFAIIILLPLRFVVVAVLILNIVTYIFNNKTNNDLQNNLKLAFNMIISLLAVLSDASGQIIIYPTILSLLAIINISFCCYVLKYSIKKLATLTLILIITYLISLYAIIELPIYQVLFILPIIPIIINRYRTNTYYLIVLTYLPLTFCIDNSAIIIAVILSTLVVTILSFDKYTVKIYLLLVLISFVYMFDISNIVLSIIYMLGSLILLLFVTKNNKELFFITLAIPFHPYLIEQFLHINIMDINNLETLILDYSLNIYIIYLLIFAFIVKYICKINNYNDFGVFKYAAFFVVMLQQPIAAILLVLIDAVQSHVYKTQNIYDYIVWPILLILASILFLPKNLIMVAVIIYISLNYLSSYITKTDVNKTNILTSIILLLMYLITMFSTEIIMNNLIAIIFIMYSLPTAYFRYKNPCKLTYLYMTTILLLIYLLAPPFVSLVILIIYLIKETTENYNSEQTTLVKSITQFILIILTAFIIVQDLLLLQLASVTTIFIIYILSYLILNKFKYQDYLLNVIIFSLPFIYTVSDLYITQLLMLLILVLLATIKLIKDRNKTLLIYIINFIAVQILLLLSIITINTVLDFNLNISFVMIVILSVYLLAFMKLSINSIKHLSNYIAQLFYVVILIITTTVTYQLTGDVFADLLIWTVAITLISDLLLLKTNLTYIEKDSILVVSLIKNIALINLIIINNDLFTSLIYAVILVAYSMLFRFVLKTKYLKDYIQIFIGLTTLVLIPNLLISVQTIIIIYLISVIKKVDLNLKAISLISFTGMLLVNIFSKNTDSLIIQIELLVITFALLYSYLNIKTNSISINQYVTYRDINLLTSLIVFIFVLFFTTLNSILIIVISLLLVVLNYKKSNDKKLLIYSLVIMILNSCYLVLDNSEYVVFNTLLISMVLLFQKEHLSKYIGLTITYLVVLYINDFIYIDIIYLLYAIFITWYLLIYRKMSHNLGIIIIPLLVIISFIFNPTTNQLILSIGIIISSLAALVSYYKINDIKTNLLMLVLLFISLIKLVFIDFSTISLLIKLILLIIFSILLIISGLYLAHRENQQLN